MVYNSLATQHGLIGQTVELKARSTTQGRRKMWFDYEWIIRLDTHTHEMMRKLTLTFGKRLAQFVILLPILHYLLIDFGG